VAPPGLGSLLPHPKRTKLAPPKQAAHVTHVFTSIVQGDLATLRSLLDTGRVRDVNEVYNGNTAAHHAAYHGHTAMLALLAQHGADFSVENKWGETALDSARSGGQERAEAFLAHQAASAPASATHAPPLLPCSAEVLRAVAWVVSHFDGAGVRARWERDAVGGQLQDALRARYETHWHTGNPQRGTGFRCLTSSPGNCDRIVEGAVHAALGEGTAAARAALRALPCEFSVWCDPGRVAVRVGGFHEDVETIFGAPWAVRSSTPPSPTLRGGSPGPAPLSPKAHTFAPTPSLGASVWAVAAGAGAGTGADGGSGGWPPSPTLAVTSDDGTGLAQQGQEQLAALWLHHQLMAQQALMQHAAFHQHQHHEHLPTQHMQFVAQGAHQQQQHHRHHSHTARHHHTAPKPESRNLAAFVMDALERKAVAA